MRKMNIGVLMGGRSAEREVSFNSGRTICDHLDTARYEVVPIFQKQCGALFILPWQFLHRGKISDFEARLDAQAERITWDSLKSRIDLAYIAMHGRYAEDGIMQGVLEVLNIPYVGSRVFASALCMDKVIQKLLLKNAGISVAQHVLLRAYEIGEGSSLIALERMHDKGITFPCVVKPRNEGSSLGVSVVFQEYELEEALMHAARASGLRSDVLIEERIEGMEFSCVTIMDYKKNEYVPLQPTEIVPDKGTHFYDYDQKYMPGRATKFTPARCSTAVIEMIQKTCVHVMRTLDITTLSRIDGFVTHDGRIVIIEPNTFSGMAPSSFIFREAAEINMSHTRLINHLIETELHARGMLDALTTQEQKESTRKGQTGERMRIAVLMGGPSNEREVSLESGRNVVYKLSPHKYDVLPIFVSQTMDLYVIDNALLVRNGTHEIAHELHRAQRISWDDLGQRVEFVFNTLHGGPGENGSVQGMLEMLGIPYNGAGVFASALCMDKYKTNTLLKLQGFDVPQHAFIPHTEWLRDERAILEHIKATVPAPWIVKPHDDGCSVFVSKAHNEDELEGAIRALFAAGKSAAFVEECIMGMELTVGVIGNAHPCALPPSKAVAAAGVLSIEEKFLPGAGENQTPAPLSKPALELVMRSMEAAYAAVGCKGYCRIDCFYQSPEQSPTGEERVVFLEFNTLPALTPATCIFHQAAEVGIRPMDFIDLIVQLGLEEHGKLADPQILQSEMMGARMGRQRLLER